MKKLLILLALCMVLSVALVACTEEPAGGDETTPEVTTPEDTTPEDTTPEDTTPEDTTPEDTTPEDTTPEDTTPGEQPPEPVKVVYAKSWDSLTKVPSGEAVFSSGEEYLTWENNAVAEVGLNDVALHVYGWIAYATETEGTVGYKINDGEVVYGEGFTDKAESGVQDYIATLDGCKSACRMHFDIPTADLAAGEYTVALYAKDPDGNEELIKEFKLTKTLPYVEMTDCADFNRWSFDGFYLNDELYFEEDGQANVKLEAINNRVPFEYGTYNYNVGFRGWVSFKQTVDSFGYYIVGTTGDIVYDEFKQERTDLVEAGIENGTGYNIVVPVMDLGYGDHLVGFVVKLADGTVVKLYEITIEVKNLVVDTETKFMVSIDFVNGKGPYNAETGEWANNYSAIGGISMGKIDAAVDHKTNDKNGILTFGGWCGVPGGVNRYVWSVDGVNWNEVVSGGVDGEPLPGYFDGLNTEEGMTSTKNGKFDGENSISIDLSQFPAGAQGNILLGAIPELNQGSVIVICELANVTVAPVVETIWYNGANGTFTVPANFETKFLIRFAVGQTIKIENAFNYAITATNVYTGETAPLMADMLGTIEVVIPEGWDLVELTIANVTAEPSEITVQILEPVVSSELIVGDNEIEVSVNGFFCPGAEMIFTAPEAGTYVFTFTEDADLGCLIITDDYSSEMVEMPYSVTLEAGQTFTFVISTDEKFMTTGGAGTVVVSLNIATGAAEEAVEDIVLSVDTLGLASNNYSAGTATLGGVDFEYIQMGNYGDGLQMRDKDGKTSMIWNTTAFAAGIARIDLVFSDSKDTYNNTDAVIFTFGNEAQGATCTTKLTTAEGEKTYTITPDADTYTFFKLEHDLKYSMYWKSITIVFADGTTASL